MKPLLFLVSRMKNPFLAGHVMQLIVSKAGGQQARSEIISAHSVPCGLGSAVCLKSPHPFPWSGLVPLSPNASHQDNQEIEKAGAHTVALDKCFFL